MTGGFEIIVVPSSPCYVSRGGVINIATCDGPGRIFGEYDVIGPTNGDTIDMPIEY